MSNEKLFRQVENLLQRKLTKEEYKFLSMASESLPSQKKPPQQTAKAAKVA